MEKRIPNQVSKIKMSEEMRTRILQNCVTQIEQNKDNENMKKNVITNFKKPAVIAATLAVCFGLTGITVLATTGEGFFKDKTNWNGAITGQTYENATDEIQVYASVEEDVLTVTVDMVKYDIAPYSEIEVLELKSYQIFDEAGNVVLENAVPENIIMENNQVKFQILAENLAEGDYKLVLDVLSGNKKADQDLLINGAWECEFTK